jgi:RNA polymerase sigma factor (sigma-70 family)
VTTPGPAIEDLLRELAPQVLGTLVRRYGRFDAAEDATQEALLRAAQRWPAEGVPDNPRAWLVTVAVRRLLDEIRAAASRRRREAAVLAATPQSELLARPADADPDVDRDDSLRLLFLCCHPALSVPSQIALTLRAVGGLTTAQIAAAFLVPEATMAQRISRAKRAVAGSGLPFAMPAGEAFAERLRSVLHVLYLIFNEGYTSSDGTELTVPHLCAEAIRLTRWLRDLLPDEAEVGGLLALMLLTDARRPARIGPDGVLVPLDEQDRSRWDRQRIAEGVALLHEVLPRGEVGPYQVQAAIAAVHDEAETMAATDWPQILGLYDLLEAIAPNPMVTLNRAVARAMVYGPAAGLELLATLEPDPRMARHHRFFATRAHLRELAGDREGALADYREAARRAVSLPERRHLTVRATRLAGPADGVISDSSPASRPGPACPSAPGCAGG